MTQEIPNVPTWMCSDGSRVTQKLPPENMIGLVPDGAEITREMLPELFKVFDYYKERYQLK